MTRTVIDAERASVEDRVKAYLKKPYTRLLVPDDDGTFRAEILEFPGCIATGDTSSEALSSLDDVAFSWLTSTLSRNQNVPEPIDNHGFSGKIMARFPKSLHKKASQVAELERVSLNQLIVASVAEYVGERTAVRREAAPSIGQVQLLNFQNINVTGVSVGSHLGNSWISQGNPNQPSIYTNPFSEALGS